MMWLSHHGVLMSSMKSIPGAALWKDGRRWTIDFWDTAGQEQFDKLHASYYFQATCLESPEF